MKLKDFDEDKFAERAGNIDVTPWRVIKWVLIAMVICSGLGIAGSYIGLFGQAVTLPAELAKRTIQPDNVIQNYEWFKRQNQAVVAIKSKAKTQAMAVKAFEQSAGDRSAWTFEDKTSHTELTRQLTGLRNQCNDLAAEYNARTEMMNRDLFRTSDLPATQSCEDTL
jgi:hypothetical protein